MFLILMESIILIPIGILLIRIINDHRNRIKFPDQSVLTKSEFEGKTDTDRKKFVNEAMSEIIQDLLPKNCKETIGKASLRNNLQYSS